MINGELMVNAMINSSVQLGAGTWEGRVVFAILGAQRFERVTTTLSLQLGPLAGTLAGCQRGDILLNKSVGAVGLSFPPSF